MENRIAGVKHKPTARRVTAAQRNNDTDKTRRLLVITVVLEGASQLDAAA